MAIKRHELQQYATASALRTELLTPDANDQVMIETLKRTFNWIEASVLPDDGKYVIKQTSIATGRWMISSASSIYLGEGKVPIVLENGNQTTETITVAGVLLSSANVPLTKVVATGEVFVTSQNVVADNTVQVVIYNNSGTQITISEISVKVLEF